LRAELAERAGERDALAGQLAETRSRLETALSRPEPAAPAADAGTDAGELRRQLADTESRLATSLRAYTVREAEIGRLQTALTAVNSERDTSATALAEARAELEALRPQVADASTVRDELDALRSELAAARELAEARAGDLASLREELATSRGTAASSSDEVATLREQLRQTQAQSAVLANQVQQLRTRLTVSGPVPASGLSAPLRPGSAPAAVALSAPAAPPAAAETPAVVAPAPAPDSAPAGPRIHVVASGDSLSSISRRYYGTANRWTEILEANRGTIANPNVLVVGTPLRVP
jgi:nucleoid-associated protein YgaU